MANRSAATAMFRGMKAWFQAYNIPVTCDFGYLKRSWNINQGPGGAARVILIPGKFDGSGPPKAQAYGTLDRDGPENYIGDDYGDPGMRNPRKVTLAWSHRIFTLSIWAVDPEESNNQYKTQEAHDLLYEQTMQAVKNSVDPETGTPMGFGNVEAYGDAILSPTPERGFGIEVLQPFTLLTTMFEPDICLAFPSPVVNKGSLTDP